MDTRSPVFRAAEEEPMRQPVAFGPFDCSELLKEQNRRHAAQTFSCVSAQIVIILLACLAMGSALMLGVDKVAAYEAALAACAGV